MTQILYSGQTISLVIPSGQRIVISTEAGSYSASLTTGANKGLVLASNSMLGATFGPYVEHEVVFLSAGEGAIVSFEVGVSPELDHHPVSRYVFDVNGNVNGFLAPDGSVYNPTDNTLTLLAADTGASLIGFKQSGTGAVATTISEVLNESVSIFRFMTPAQIADVKAGTASIDVTSALQMAADEALASGRFLTGYSGAALVTSTLNLKCSGDLSNLTIKANATLVNPVVRFGTTSGLPTTSKNMKLPVITNTARVSGNWGTGVGLEIANTNGNQLYIPSVTNFEYGLSVGGYNSGAAYNVVTLGLVYSNKINIRLIPLASGGWSNQNTFIGGRLGINSTDFTVSGYVGTRNIVFAKGAATSGGANNNTFINTSVESNLVEYTIEFNESTGFNKLIGLRYEGSSQNVLFHTNTASGNVYNTFEGGYQVNQLLFTFTGTGSSPYNSILSGAISKMEGTGSVLNIVNNTSNSNIAPHVQGFVAGARVVSKDEASTDWAYRLYTQGLEGKRSTDTYARLKMDFNNGRIYFDNGTTATPTSYIGNLGANGFGFAGTLNPAANSTYTAGSSSFRWSESYVNTMFIGTGTTRITSGAGSPEGVLTASIGSLFTRTDGGAGTTLYVKESGAGNTGWVAK